MVWCVASWTAGRVSSLGGMTSGYKYWHLGQKVSPRWSVTSIVQEVKQSQRDIFGAYYMESTHEAQSETFGEDMEKDFQLAAQKGISI